MVPMFKWGLALENFPDAGSAYPLENTVGTRHVSIPFPLICVQVTLTQVTTNCPAGCRVRSGGVPDRAPCTAVQSLRCWRQYLSTCAHKARLYASSETRTTRAVETAGNDPGRGELSLEHDGDR